MIIENKYCKSCGKLIKPKNYQCYAVYKRMKYCNQECYFKYRRKNQHHKNIYSRYQDMKMRCYNSNKCNYKHYGARGIKICDEWLENNGYNNFENWALTNGYKKELSIDRINKDSDYSPDNCRWVNQRIQNINKKPSKKNTSGFVGIQKRSDYDLYSGYVKVNEKAYYTGTSKDIIIAAIMRNNFIIDNNLENELNDLSQFKDSYDMEIRYEAGKQNSFGIRH